MDDSTRTNDSGHEADSTFPEPPSPEPVRDTESSTHHEITQLALEFARKFNFQTPQPSTSKNVETDKDAPVPHPDSPSEPLHSSFEVSRVDEEDEDDDRVMKDVPKPNPERLARDVVFDEETGEPRCITIREHFREEGRLEESVALEILERGAQILAAEPTLLDLESPMVIVGDIHGQYYDLLRIFEIGGPVNERHRYLFLGDYVDRGYFSTECLLYLLALKIKNPNNIFLLRGNHECEHTTKYFTYEHECEVKYSTAVYDASVKVFQALPLAAVLDGVYFCVHGGLSPELHTLRDIRNTDRFREIPTYGPMCDLLWADPTENFGYEKTKDHYVHNSARGCSYYYSYDAVCDFLKRNELFSMIRGHEALHAGYQLYKNTSQDFPAMVTVFSCPNYCDVYKNRGAIIVFGENKFHIKQFNETPHPYCLPDFMDAFSWSLPFVAENVTGMLHAILNLCPPEELEADEEEKDLSLEQRQLRREKIRNKMRLVGKIATGYNKLNRQNQASVKLAGLSPTRSRAGPVLDQVEKLATDTDLSFEEIKNLDSINEKLPNISDTGDEQNT